MIGRTFGPWLLGGALAWGAGGRAWSGSCDERWWYPDRDGDGHGDGTAEPVLGCDLSGQGYSTSPTDCDDGDPRVRPGAPESCDGVDEDCDGESDDVERTVWVAPDRDGDGFGVTAERERVGCPVEGFVTWGGDCDDGDAEAFPGALDTCDGRDENCNGVVDDGPKWVWYDDRDGDGVGDADTAVVASCPPGDSWVMHPGDCDDLAPALASECPGPAGAVVGPERLELRCGTTGPAGLGAGWVAGLAARRRRGRGAGCRPGVQEAA